MNHLELQHVSVFVQCVDVRAEAPCLQGLLHASMCLWTTIVPVCVHMYHLRYPIPDCYLVKCLWAALCGFPSLKGLVNLNVDCHDVSSKPQHCLLCVTVTIYFRPVCEKRLYFHLCDSLTWTVRSKHCATVTGPEPPPRWMRSLIFALAQPIKNNRLGRRCMRNEPLGDSLII